MKGFDKGDARRAIAASAVLGYGAELADALERYGAAPREERDHPDKVALREAWSAWMARCPAANHLCFADITFFSPDLVTVRDALTVVIAPSAGIKGAGNYDAYIAALEEYLQRGSPNGHTMAPHKVFAGGLPMRVSDGQVVEIPETSDDLAAFWERLGSDPKSRIDNGLFLANLTGDEVPQRTADSWDTLPPVSLHTAEMKTYATQPKAAFTEEFAERASQRPISEHWQAWLDVFQVRRDRGELLSIHGRRPFWLVAAPVGMRDSSYPPEYTLVSCIFLAFDGCLTREAVLDAVRYILLHLYEANATLWAKRQAEARGENSAVVAARHELRYVVAAIAPGISDRGLHLIQDYFRQVLHDNPSAAKPMAVKLIDLINRSLLQAAEIEHMIRLSQKGSLGRLTTEELDADISAFAEVVQRSFHFSPGNIELRTGDPELLEYFSLAIVCAFRNAIKHSFGQSSYKQKLTLTVKTAADAVLLQLDNSFSRAVTSELRMAELPKSLSTKRSLEIFARQYRMDPRLVKVDLFDTTRVAMSDSIELSETWRTLFPVPDVGIMTVGDP